MKSKIKPLAIFLILFFSLLFVFFLHVKKSQAITPTPGPCSGLCVPFDCPFGSASGTCSSGNKCCRIPPEFFTPTPAPLTPTPGPCSGLCVPFDCPFGSASGTCSSGNKCCRIPDISSFITPTPKPFACQTNGQTRCVSNAIYEKCIGNEWVIVKNCAESNQVCVEGIGCTTKPNTCTTPGQVACDGAVVIICTGGKWQVLSICSKGQLCVGGRCTSIPPQCTTGQKKCEGNNYLVCQDNYWHLKEDCNLSKKTCTSNGCLGQAPTLPPPTSPSCQKSQGDANCDGKTDKTDFEIWRKEYLGGTGTKTADFNNDGRVDIVDFEIWRKGFFMPQTTTAPKPTATSTPTTPGQPTATPRPTNPPGQPTPTEAPGSTATPIPTATVRPTATNTPRPTNTPGPGSWHWACVGTVCDIVTGAGADTCRIDDECREPTATPIATKTPIPTKKPTATLTPRPKDI